MVRFNTVDYDGFFHGWEFESTEELREAWEDAGAYLPANDDELRYVEIDGERKEIPEGAYFEDLLTMLGIDIWGV